MTFTPDCKAPSHKVRGERMHNTLLLAMLAVVLTALLPNATYAQQATLADRLHLPAERRQQPRP